MATVIDSPATYNLWESTAAFEVIELVDTNGLTILVGIIGSLVAIYTAFAASSGAESRDIEKSCGTLASLAFIAGLSAYATCLQLETLDFVQWAASFASPKVLLPVALFIILVAARFQIEIVRCAGGSRGSWPIRVHLIAVVSFLLGFAACYIMLRVDITVGRSGFARWLVLLGLMLIVLAVGRVAKWLVHRQAAKAEASSSASNRQLLARSIKMAGVTFVILVVGLKAFSFVAADSPGFIAQEVALPETSISDDMARREVTPNIMLAEKRRVNYRADKTVYCQLEYTYDSTGNMVDVWGLLADGSPYLHASEQFDTREKLVDEIKRNDYAIYASKLVDSDIVETIRYDEEPSMGRQWTDTEWVYRKNGWKEKTYYQLDSDLGEIKRTDYDYTSDTYDYTGYTTRLTDGTLEVKWVFDLDSFGEISQRNCFRDEGAEPTFVDKRAPNGKWLRIHENGYTELVED